MDKSKSRKRKVVKIEDVVRDKEDFMVKPIMGYSGYRIKNSGKKLEIPLEDRLRFNVKRIIALLVIRKLPN